MAGKEEALRKGERAMELLPVAKHSVNGPHMIEYFALIAAWMGEKELACEHMEIMDSYRWQQLKLILAEALEQESPAARTALVGLSCGKPME